MRLSPNIDLTIKGTMRLTDESNPQTDQELEDIAHEGWENIDFLIGINDAATALLGACVVFWNILWVSYFNYFFPKMKVLTTRKMMYPVLIYLIIFFLLMYVF